MRLRPTLAWLVIFACILYFVFESRPSIADPSSPANLSTPQFTLQSRYILGMKSLFDSVLNRPADQDASFVRVITQTARTPIERLRLAPVLAELEGTRAALKQLEATKRELHDPDLQRDAALFRTVYTISPDALSQEEKQTLLTRHAYFAKLALSYGKRPSDPLRQEVLSAARRTAIAAISIMIVALIGAVIGLALLILAIVLFATGELRPRFIPPPQPTTRFLESFAHYLAGMLALSLLFHYVIGPRGLWPSSLLLLLVPLGLAWPAKKFGLPATARAIGFIPSASPAPPRAALPLRVAQEFFAGIAGYLAGLPLLALGLIATVILNRFSHANPEHPIIHAVGRSPWITVQIYLLAVLVAPMVEETFFRGALYSHLRGRWGWLLSSLFTAGIFAIIHPQGWTTLPVLAAIGFTLATIREWRNSLLAPMTAHALNNFLATTFLTLALS